MQETNKMIGLQKLQFMSKCYEIAQEVNKEATLNEEAKYNTFLEKVNEYQKNGKVAYTKNDLLKAPLRIIAFKNIDKDFIPDNDNKEYINAAFDEIGLSALDTILQDKQIHDKIKLEYFAKVFNNEPQAALEILKNHTTILIICLNRIVSEDPVIALDAIIKSKSLEAKTKIKYIEQSLQDKNCTNSEMVNMLSNIIQYNDNEQVTENMQIPEEIIIRLKEKIKFEKNDLPGIINNKSIDDDTKNFYIKGVITSFNSANEFLGFKTFIDDTNIDSKTRDASIKILIKNSLNYIKETSKTAQGVGSLKSLPNNPIDTIVLSELERTQQNATNNYVETNECMIESSLSQKCETILTDLDNGQLDFIQKVVKAILKFVGATDIAESYEAKHKEADSIIKYKSFAKKVLENQNTQEVALV